MRDQYYVSQAMSKYPQAPCSDLVRTWFLQLSFAVVDNREWILIKDFPKQSCVPFDYVPRLGPALFRGCHIIIFFFFFVLIHRFLSHGHCRWGYPRFLIVSEGVWKGDLSPNGGKRLTTSLWHWGAWRRFDIHLQGLFLTLFTLLTKTNFLNEEFPYSNNIIRLITRGKRVLSHSCCVLSLGNMCWDWVKRWCHVFSRAGFAVRNQARSQEFPRSMMIRVFGFWLCYRSPVSSDIIKPSRVICGHILFHSDLWSYGEEAYEVAISRRIESWMFSCLLDMEGFNELWGMIGNVFDVVGICIEGRKWGTVG